VGSFFRKPLGLFTAIVTVGLILIVAGMSAFGGTSGAAYHAPKPLTPAQFHRAGVRICRFERPQVRWLLTHKPKNLREVTRFVARGTSIVDRVTTEVSGLIPPPSKAALVRRLSRLLGVADHALHRLNHLTETRQWGRAVLLIRSRWWKRIGTRLGPPTKPKHMDCNHPWGPSPPPRGSSLA
jgi:hypothetical protein